ncbi:MAG: MFS transporter [Oscillospiraceae bacterium]|nr:MFS transporter [Oscillospiraceae bacterium]
MSLKEREFFKKPYIFYLYYFNIFLFGVVQGSFISMYLTEIGVPSGYIGIINGVIQVLCLGMSSLYGVIADNARSKNRVLVTILCISVVLLYAFSRTTSLLMVIILRILFNITYQPMMGLYESMALECSKRYGYAYSPIRMSGTIGYAVMAVISGFWLNKNKEMLFPILIGTLLLTLITAFFLPEVGKTEKKDEAAEKYDIREVYALLRDKSVLRVLIMYLFYMLCNSFSHAYFGIYMTQLGGDYAWVGIGNMILAVSEFPFYFGPGNRFFRRLGVEKSQLFILCLGVIRWLIVGTCHSPVILTLTMLFNGVMLVPNATLVVEFLSEKAPENLKSSVQTALRAPFSTAGNLIASFGGGALVGLFNGMGLDGVRLAYLCCAPLTLIAVLLIAPSVLRSAKDRNT